MVPDVRESDLREGAPQYCQASVRFRMLVLAYHPDKVTRMHIIELVTRALVQHIGIDPIRTKQRNPLLGRCSLGFETAQFGGQQHDFLIEFLPRSEAVFARVGIDPEISNHRRRDRIEREAGHDCFESCA